MYEKSKNSRAVCIKSTYVGVSSVATCCLVLQLTIIKFYYGLARHRWPHECAPMKLSLVVGGNGM